MTPEEILRRPSGLFRVLTDRGEFPPEITKSASCTASYGSSPDAGHALQGPRLKGHCDLPEATVREDRLGARLRARYSDDAYGVLEADRIFTIPQLECEVMDGGRTIQ